MHEVCFCGYGGNLEDRLAVYGGDGEWGLACPRCGHLDRLGWLPLNRRVSILRVAALGTTEGQERRRTVGAGGGRESQGINTRHSNPKEERSIL